MLGDKEEKILIVVMGIVAVIMLMALIGKFF